MPSAILQQLDRFGPQRCEAMTYQQAADYTAHLARTHDENFSVVTRLVPRRLREDFANVYAFCRWADDLGDETGDRRRSLELLAWWRRELDLCYLNAPRHPVFIVLHRTIQRHNIPAQPFEDLIDAFVQDQRVDRYESWDQVLHYCRRSADPVGRLVLYLCGHRDPARQALADQTCTALQLVNFWQDVRRDIVERNRIYVPTEALAPHKLTHQMLTDHVRGLEALTPAQHERYRAVIHDLIERTRPMFAEGRKLWPRVARDVRLPIMLFSMGGETVIERIEQINYDTLDRRVTVSKATKLRLMARAWFGRFFVRERDGDDEPGAAPLAGPAVPPAPTERSA